MGHRMQFRWALCFTLYATLACAVDALAQPAARESAVKAAFLFKFPAFVEWPATVFQRADQPLVIGVVGDDDVAADLEQIATGRNVEGHPVVVRRIPEGSGPGSCHVLYVGARSEARLQQAIESAPGPVLIVTGQPGALRLGSVLNFQADAGRIRFSASLAAADARGLRLSARLLAVAQNVEGRRP